MRMKMFRLFALLCVALLAVVGCKKDDLADEKLNGTFFYVKYSGHCSAFSVTRQATMIITNKEGKEERYQIGDKEVTVGPVHVGFEARLHIINPDGGMFSGRIEVSRNSDSKFKDCVNFNSSEPEGMISYTIQRDTGL